MMKQQRVTNAYNTTLAAMRQARDNAVSQRTSYSVTFSTTAPAEHDHRIPHADGRITGVAEYRDLSIADGRVVYCAIGAVSATAPDSYGTGLTAIDFGYTANGATGGQRRFTSARTVRRRMPKAEQGIVPAVGTGASCTSGVQENC